jgi:hypothetical protein
MLDAKAPAELDVENGEVFRELGVLGEVFSMHGVP